MCQHNALTSHPGLTPHTLHSSKLPPGLALISPSPFLCLLASQNQASLQNSPARKYLCQTQGLGCPKQKRAGSRQTEPVTPYTNHFAIT